MQIQLTTTTKHNNNHTQHNIKRKLYKGFKYIRDGAILKSEVK
jgi:hypothetical protein